MVLVLRSIVLRSIVEQVVLSLFSQEHITVRDNYREPT